MAGCLPKRSILSTRTCDRWPARYAAIIAAKLNTDPHTTEIILDQCIKAHLRELAEPRVTL